MKPTTGIDFDELLADLDRRRALALELYRRDPLPRTECEARLRLEAEIAFHGLEKNVAELETRGYTVLPTGIGASTDLIERIRDAVLRVADTRAATKPFLPALGRTMMHLLPEDRAFEEALMNPATLALVTYLVGYRAKLMSSTAIVKTREHEGNLQLHADSSKKLPNPWPAVAQFANVTYLLSDYDRENGTLCIVPGSHSQRRQVPRERMMAHDDEDAVLIEAPAGTVIVWHGNLWHGAVARTAPGQRITLVLAFCRAHIQTQEAHYLTTTSEMIARNPARFSVLTNVLSSYPWSKDGPDERLVAQTPYEFERWA